MKLNISDLAKNLSKDMKDKGSNRLIRRAGTFEAGTYKVVIAAIDTTTLESGKITLTFEAQHKEQHKQVLFLTNFGGDGLSDGLEALLFGLFGTSEQALGSWLEVLSKPEHAKQAFEMLRGMKLQVDIGETSGFIIVNRNGKYYAVDNKTGDEYAGPFQRRIQVKRTALADGHKEPKSILLDGVPTNADENIQALQNCIKAITGTETSGADNGVRLEAIK